VRAQQLAEQRSVAAPRILAITTDRKIRLPAERAQECDHALRVRASHLPQISFRECGPARVRPRLLLGIRNEVAAWRNLRQPHVEEVPFGVILFSHTARQQPHGAETNAFTACSRRSESYDLNHL
jgi:hypothetical protein